MIDEGDARLKLTVVVPLYNKAAFVESALASILSQTPRPLEVIVVDDGSTDGSADVVADLKHPDVTLLRVTNAGVAAARNAGIARAAGEWIGFLDADDAWLPGFTATIQQMAADFPQARVLSTGYATVDPAGRRALRAASTWTSARPALVTDFFARWRKASFTCTNSIVVRRDALQCTGTPFLLGERLGEDQDLWFRLAEAFGFVHCPTALTLYRLGVPGSATDTASNTELLGCYTRLNQRAGGSAFPARQRRAARRLVASHWINVARARFARGDVSGGWRLLREPPARAGGVYWLRTWLLFMTGSRAKADRMVGKTRT